MNKQSAPPKKGLSLGAAKRLLTYLKPYRLRFVAVCACILLSSAASVSSSLFIKILIDQYIEPLLLMANPIFTPLLKALAMLGCLYLAGILATLAYTRMMVAIAQGMLREIRREMFSHMQTLPVRYFDTHSHGDLMSHYTNDVDALEMMISQTIPNAFSSLITLAAVFVAMIVLSPWLTLVVVACVSLMLIVAKQVGKRSAGQFRMQQSALGSLNGFIEEMINGQRVIKVFSHEERTQADFDGHNTKLVNAAAGANMFANSFMPLMLNLGNLQYVLVALVGGTLAIHGLGGLTLGAIASFLSLSRSFSMPITQISQQMTAISMALAGAERIFDLMDAPSESDEGEITLVNVLCEDGKLTETDAGTGHWAWKRPLPEGKFGYTQLKGDVRFFDVTFGYEDGKTVLNNISLFAKPGQKIAFVGSTGAGKTTITNLINRFYDTLEGSITFDGIEVREIHKSDLRRSLGMVLQDTNLFSGSILENIRYGKPEASDEEVLAAAKLANAHGWIMRLPKGYDTLISGNGESLSQGQRQLLSIARTALADPPVMVLDEATSSIDTRTESLVQQGMDRLMQGRTVFVIAHRLSTVRNSQAILVLEHGNIIERGDHEQLLAEKGHYYQLYTGAFELE